MASIKDWALAAADYIVQDGKCRHNPERVAAILDAFLTPMTTLLRQAKREHAKGFHDEACDHAPCPKSYEDAADDAECNCIADAWNARIDSVLSYRNLTDVSAQDKHDGVFWTGVDTYIRTQKDLGPDEVIERIERDLEPFVIESHPYDDASAPEMMKEFFDLGVGSTVSMKFFGQEVELVVTKVKRS